jgi:hypothetical protein
MYRVINRTPAEKTMPTKTALTSCALAVALAVLGATLPPTPAEAASYWTCRCKGTTKRFVYGTYACEADRERERNTGKRVSSGFKLYVPRCDRAQWTSYRAKVCAQNQCRVPR